MKQYGDVGDDGRFFLRLVFDNHDSEDMDQMMRLLNDPEQYATVMEYSEEQVEVRVYPQVF